MALNYQFYNNTLQDVKDEIHRRERAYWPEGHINNSALAWNYQKTAYIILKSRFPTSGQTIQTLTAPILELYGPDYTKSNGTLKGAVLNSAEINVEGTYGSILRITVNFTVFDKDELDKYMNNFLRPGVDIGLEWGWTVNEFAGNKGKDGTPVYVNKSDIHGTVFNFSFSAKEDGTWDCSLHAYGPSMMTYGFNIDAKDSENKPDSTNFATYGLLEIFQAVKENIQELYEKGDIVAGTGTSENDVCKKIWTGQLTGYFKTNFGVRMANQANSTLDQKEGPIFYLYNLILSNEIGEDDLKFSPMAYITLDNLVKLVNDKINYVSQRPVPNYSFQIDNKNVCVGTDLDKDFLSAGPANAYNIIKEVDNTIFADEYGISSQFAFTTQKNAKDDSVWRLTLSLLNSQEKFVDELKGTNIPLQHLILINVDFILQQLREVLKGNTYVRDKKILSFFKLLFRQLETNTGGIINLDVLPQRNINGVIESITIVNINGDPENQSKSIVPFPIKMMTKGSVVRAMSIESKVPDAVITEVGTFTRAGLSYGEDSDDNKLNITKADSDSQTLLLELKELNDMWIWNVKSNGDRNALSTRRWNDKVMNIYRKLASIKQTITLNSEGKSISKFNIFNLKTAIFPIYLKLTLDGINGFLYGNAITTNWLPKQYRDSRIYWTVTKIRHRIENNDWITELEAIYRVKEK